MDLDLPIRTSGRASVPVTAEIVRELTPADLSMLNTDRGVKPSALKRLTQSHHGLARALAQGMRPCEAHVVTGYSPSRISILQADPAFQDLIAFYKNVKDQAFADMHALMADLSVDVLAEIRERLENEPEEIGTGMLLDIMKMVTDRTGHGPQSRTVNTNINVNLAERVAAGRARVGLAGASARVERGASPSPLTIDN